MENLEEILAEIYDLCNEIAKDENFNDDEIKNSFYSEKELENYRKRSRKVL